MENLLIFLSLKREGDLVPKGFIANAKYLLTRQRFDILKKVVDGSSGFVFSGPHGISKSYTLYLIAVYAFVNSIPLLYVPVCGHWVSIFHTANQVGANDYLRNLFLSLNSDILSRDQIIEIQKSPDVVNYLSRNFGNERSVFYLFDEHHELFEPNTEGNIPAMESYFQDFTRWTKAKYTTTIYCGSAHSSFEDNLPGGEVEKVVRIIPPTTEEFETLVSDFGLDPKDKRIAQVTGRIPRELRYLAGFLKGKKLDDEDFNQFITNMQGTYDQRLDLLANKLDKKNKEQFEKTLEELFTLSDGRPHNVPGVVYDKG